MILCFPNSLGEGPLLLPNDNAPGHTARSIQKWLVWKNLTSLYRALTSTPSTTFGVNWKANREPGPISAQPHQSTFLAE
uniref:Uncharacterized protein n=1 Tax=Anguilla anguilla TaxID=7936 RepID=A0A0E9VA60_ANGAN